MIPPLAQMETSANLVAEIVRNGGIMGVVWLLTLIPLAVYTKGIINKSEESSRNFSKSLNDLHTVQSAELVKLQQQRADDAQKVVDKLLELNDKWNTTIAESTRAVEAVASTMDDVKTALNGVRDLLMHNKRD